MYINDIYLYFILRSTTVGGGFLSGLLQYEYAPFPKHFVSEPIRGTGPQCLTLELYLLVGATGAA